MTTKFEIDCNTSLIQNIPFIPSPNFNDRPPETIIDLLVIHGISLPPGQFGGPAINALFTNTLDPNADPSFKEIASIPVSSHLLIRRDGSVIQYVPFDKRAWHAGVSSFQGRSNCNDYSIGIELEGVDTIPYEKNQYQQLINLVSALIRVYPAITLERIVGHCDIAPSRKTDPGPAFDWNYFRRMFRLSGCV
jgi:N-acetyl-anhydromuramoyl-L-alanine amidase